MSKEKRISGKFRKWCHILHRDLSFFFAGVILIYAFSGIMLNHKRDFNSDYSITQKEYRIAGNFPKAKADFSKAYSICSMTWVSVTTIPNIISRKRTP